MRTVVFFTSVLKHLLWLRKGSLEKTNDLWYLFVGGIWGGKKKRGKKNIPIQCLSADI